MARILIVDDEHAIRRLLRTALEQAGHEVLEASHGREAVKIQEALPADLVITDIIMPEQDGVEVIMALRGRDPKLKIIAMSGGGRFSLTEALELAEPLGAVGVVRKPFTVDSMLETVRQALAA